MRGVHYSDQVLATVSHRLTLAVDLLASQQRLEVIRGGPLSGFARVWPHGVDAWNRDEILEGLRRSIDLSPFHITKASSVEGWDMVVARSRKFHSTLILSVARPNS